VKRRLDSNCGPPVVYLASSTYLCFPPKIGCTSVQGRIMSVPTGWQVFETIGKVGWRTDSSTSACDDISGWWELFVLFHTSASETQPFPTASHDPTPTGYDSRQKTMYVQCHPRTSPQPFHHSVPGIACRRPLTAQRDFQVRLHTHIYIYIYILVYL
jgi:hypothetical protein